MSAPVNQATASQLLDLATRFRTAIEQCDRKRLPITFEDFPRGSCGDAALLLGTFLTEMDCGDFDYVLGERGTMSDDTWHSHAWIEGNGFIVDITADQFADVAESVLVLPTAASLWHARFNQERLNRADYRIYDSHTRAELGRAYRAVRETLEAVEADKQ